MNGHGWNGGGDDLNVGEEVTAVLGEWGCFLQGWDLVDRRHEIEGVIAALGEWDCFLRAWGCHPGELGRHLGEGASDREGDSDLTGWHGHVIWGMGGVSAGSGSISPDGMVMSSGGFGGGCQPAQNHVSSFFVFSFFFLFLLFFFCLIQLPKTSFFIL